MKLIRDMVSAASVTAGTLVLCGALFVATAPVAPAAVVIAPAPATGTCILSVGGSCTSNTNDPCTGKCEYNNSTAGCDCK